MDLDIINMKSNKCVILIPIYKEFINFDEYRSIQNTINLYNDKYDIFFMCNNKLNISFYKNIFNIDYKIFDYNLFHDAHSYSALLMNRFFYKQFLNYEFMLIAQHDAYIFNTYSLEYFMNKNYPYLGALFKLYDLENLLEIEFINDAFNNNYNVKDLKKIIFEKYNTNFNYCIDCTLGMSGGLSLRKIDVIYHLLKQNLEWHWAEDLKICSMLDTHNLFDNILIKDIINFSMENEKYLDFYKEHNILPYSVHGIPYYFFMNMYDRII